VPTYQYACTACGHQLEAVQSFSDPALTDCPACEGRLRKLFSSVGIVFKGSGFYRTDSRSGANGGESAETKSKENGSTPKSTPSEGSSSTSSTPSAPSTPSTSSSSGDGSGSTSSAKAPSAA